MLGALNSRSNGSRYSRRCGADRIFVYEVTGLRQNNDNDANNYAFRSSSSVFINVPYNRMNEEMQRILKMGGSIVNISLLGAAQKFASTSDSGSQE